MCFKDWRGIYDNLFSCVDFADHWFGIRFKDEWTPQNSGGVPTTANREDAERWSKNPQFYLDLRNKSEVFLSLSQEDGRFIKDGEFPYEGNVRTTCFAIIKLEPNEETASFFDAKKIVSLSVLKLHREVHKRVNLDMGRYVIVPATRYAGETGSF